MLWVPVAAPISQKRKTDRQNSLLKSLNGTSVELAKITQDLQSKPAWVKVQDSFCTHHPFLPAPVSPKTRFRSPLPSIQGFPGDTVAKNPLANRDAGDTSLIPGSRKGNCNPFQYSCLGNPKNRGAWRATVHVVANSQTWLRDWARTHTHTHTHTHASIHQEQVSNLWHRQLQGQHPCNLEASNFKHLQFQAQERRFDSAVFVFF